MSEEKSKKLKWDGFWLAVVVLIAALGISMLISLLFSIVLIFQTTVEQITDPKVIEQLSLDALLKCNLLMHILFLVTFYCWYYFGCAKRQKIKLKTVMSKKNVLSLIICVISVNFCMSGMLSVMTYIIPKTMENYAQLLEQAGVGTSMLTNLAVVLIAPFGEELIFRGTVWHYLQKFTSGIDNKKKAFWIVNTIQAVMFGVFHLNIVQGVYAFFLGLLCGFYREKYQSVKASILFHMVFNGSSLLIISPILMLFPETLLTFILTIIIGGTVFGLSFWKLEQIKKIQE